MIRFYAAICLGVFFATAAVAQAPATNPQPSEAPSTTAHVDGFRNARWGMTEAEVKSAIFAQFKIPIDKLKAEVNPTEKTTVLPISVPDLIEGAGTARISYILGYQTKRLIEVNIVWGTAVDPQAKPEMVVAAAHQLRDLFLASGYDPSTVATNARGSDGSIVVFTGQDTDKHTTVLRLLQRAGNEKEKQPPATALFLSYVMDSRHPDIFRLKSG
ncbi:MAG TPA: hypothetical protein VME45_13985, partial [Stellaceae bacterium]|nr:hypothetical protein [Stellaceae bacterium]